MYRPRVIPTLLLKGDGLVKSIQFKKHNYIGDPINAVKIFNDLKADELVFLDIEATKETVRNQITNLALFMWYSSFILIVSSLFGSSLHL